MSVIRPLRRALTQARDLREQLLENIRTRSFSADDLDMVTYNNILVLAASVLPEDGVLASMEMMPDSNLRGYVSMMQIPPAPAVTERLVSHLTTFINHLEVLLDVPPDVSRPKRSAEQVLREEKTGEARSILEALERLGPGLHPANVDQLNFNFVSGRPLREVLRQDFVEAQLSFGAGAFKATALLAGALIEGMLLDALQSPDTKANDKYPQAVQGFPRAGGEIDWDRVSLTQLIKAGVELSLLTETEQRFAAGARDYRDTVHPNAEVRQRVRAKKEEAELLLALVKLTYRNLDSGDKESPPT
jgi:hypothetical protein